MSKSYTEINQFAVTANNWLARNPQESRFRYALNKVVKTATQLLTECQEKAEEIKIDNCVTDSEGVILRDEKSELRFTKDGLKKCNREIKELFQSSVEIEPHFASGIPEHLTVTERAFFTGFVLREEPDLSLVNGKTEDAETVN